jgi:hypothetical protein
MDIGFAHREFGRALSILCSHPDRIQERLGSAYSNALSHIPRENIPEHLLNKYDSIMKKLEWTKGTSSPPSDDDANLLVRAIEDLTALLSEEY